MSHAMLEVPSRPRARLNALNLYGLFGLCLVTAVHLGFVPADARPAEESAESAVQ